MRKRLGNKIMAFLIGLCVFGLGLLWLRKAVENSSSVVRLPAQQYPIAAWDLAWPPSVVEVAIQDAKIAFPPERSSRVSAASASPQSLELPAENLTPPEVSQEPPAIELPASSDAVWEDSNFLSKSSTTTFSAPAAGPQEKLLAEPYLPEKPDAKAGTAPWDWVSTSGDIQFHRDSQWGTKTLFRKESISAVLENPKDAGAAPAETNLDMDSYLVSRLYLYQWGKADRYLRLGVSPGIGYMDIKDPKTPETEAEPNSQSALGISAASMLEGQIQGWSIGLKQQNMLVHGPRDFVFSTYEFSTGYKLDF